MYIKVTEWEQKLPIDGYYIPPFILQYLQAKVQLVNWLDLTTCFNNMS